jgi:6-pyruvoyl-tetrahydropterin synthase
MKCFYNHGHTYSLDVEWEGFPTDREPMISPFGELKGYTQTLVRCCDHHNLNEVFDFPTTLENVGNWFFKRLKTFETEKLKLKSIVLQEGSNNRVKVENI